MAIINKRKKEIETGEGKCDDLLGILLESNKKEVEEHGVGLSMEEVIGECKLFYTAGSETTSNLVVWTMVCLSLHHEWQIRAQEDILQVFRKGELDFEGLKNLKILTMIVSEVLKLYTPLNMMTRATHKETKLGNTMIPSGVLLALAIMHVHHDPDIWGDDVTEFKPERFSEGIMNATKGKVSSVFFPFSSGPRVCVGQNFAMTEAKTAMAMILQRFSFELSPSYKHSTFAIITIPPQFGAHLILFFFLRKKMETMGKVAIAIVVAVVVRWGWKLLNWVWLKPKKLEKWLREEGYKGNSYKFLMGDMIDLATMVKEGKSKPIPVTRDITSYALPFDHHIISKYGEKSFVWFIPTRANKKFIKNIKEVRSVLVAIINKRKKEIETGEGKSDDLLGILLESNKKEIEEYGIGLSMEEVIDECKLFYTVGSETTSNLVVWTMVCLSLHQEWQIRAQEEILQVFGNKELDCEGLKKDLKVLTMILNEVLRLYTPVSMMTRATHKETKLGNMMIPSGVLLSLPMMHVHHDRKIWGDDVNEFKPERFAQGIMNATKGKGSSPFFPFSNGPRVCLGQNLAMAEAKTAMAMILQRFSFELSPSYKHSPFSVISIPPQFGAHLILHIIS
ncbi:hypothetical protein L1987_61768 [Smallanthus sonchifolius]|uniref:Uncharacterized protein n=1 Tax=Smallanthus sonchifolius TaxID=185202 RepID=A0ACB9C8K1_9ASTR|nr:hypothetical protein L1987_61768 [Smallanthus sonchifolius]